MNCTLLNGILVFNGILVLTVQMVLNDSCCEICKLFEPLHTIYATIFPPIRRAVCVHEYSYESSSGEKSERCILKSLERSFHLCLVHY